MDKKKLIENQIGKVAKLNRIVVLGEQNKSTLLCLIGRGGGVVNCKFWGKNPSSSFNYYKRMTKPPPPPILKNLDSYPPTPECFLFDPSPLQLGTKE